MAARRIPTLTAVVAVVGLTACGTAGTSPSVAPSTPPEASPTLQPSPTPSVDIGEAFLERLAGEMALVAEISGAVTLGSLSGDISGALSVDAGNMHQLLTIEVPGVIDQTQEQVTIDGVTYTRQPSGIWLVEQAPAGGDGGEHILSSVLSGSKKLAVAGEETWNGRDVVRLEPQGKAEIGPDTLGLTDPSISDVSGSIAFFAEPDGTPAGLEMVVTWTQLADTTTIDCAMEMRFTFDFDGAVTVEAPDDAWTMYQSAELGYRMAYPVTWDAAHKAATDEFAAFDRFVGPAGEEIQVYLYTEIPAGVLPNDWFRDSALAFEQDYGVVPEVLGDLTTADGKEVRLFAGNLIDGTLKVYVISAAVFGGSTAWDVDWIANAGTEEDDLATLSTFVQTFAADGG